MDSRGQRSKNLSAQLVIFDPASREEGTEKLFAGSTFNIGADQYCLVQVHEGTRDELGWASLQKKVAAPRCSRACQRSALTAITFKRDARVVD